MNEDRLNELPNEKFEEWRIHAGQGKACVLSEIELQGVVALHRRCNELEAENAALKDVNWDISYPDGESLATKEADNDCD